MSTPRQNLLGNGLQAPLRRLAGVDFVSASGGDLVASAIRQILGTEQGELPWNPSFGGGMEKYRHENMTEELASKVQAQVFSALTRFEPRAHVSELAVARKGTKLEVTIHWVLVEPNGRSAENVIAGPFSTTVEV